MERRKVGRGNIMYMLSGALGHWSVIPNALRWAPPLAGFLNKRHVPDHRFSRDLTTLFVSRPRYYGRNVVFKPHDIYQALSVTSKGTCFFEYDLRPKGAHSVTVRKHVVHEEGQVATSARCSLYCFFSNFGTCMSSIFTTASFRASICALRSVARWHDRFRDYNPKPLQI